MVLTKTGLKISLIKQVGRYIFLMNDGLIINTRAIRRRVTPEPPDSNEAPAFPYHESDAWRSISQQCFFLCPNTDTDPVKSVRLTTVDTDSDLAPVQPIASTSDTFPADELIEGPAPDLVLSPSPLIPTPSTSSGELIEGVVPDDHAPLPLPPQSRATTRKKKPPSYLDDYVT